MHVSVVPARLYADRYLIDARQGVLLLLMGHALKPGTGPIFMPCPQSQLACTRPHSMPWVVLAPLVIAKWQEAQRSTPASAEWRAQSIRNGVS